MKTCLHCGETFQRSLDPAIGNLENELTPHPRLVNLSNNAYIGAISENDNFIHYGLKAGKCPKCGEITLIVEKFTRKFVNKLPLTNSQEVVSILPLFSERPVNGSVPQIIADDYKQATKIFSLSRKASATLARRCLQATFRNKFPEMGKKPNLKQEIDWVIKNGGLEEEINDVLHNLREAGNFGAHPSEDGLTEIYDLSQEDLEACFLLLDHLFDTFYVQPAKKKEKLAKMKNIPSSKK